MTLHVPANQLPLPILMVTGLAKEMRLAEGPGLVAIASGGDTKKLRGLLADRAVPGCRAVLSFGIAGGLDPSLAAGDVVVATGVVAEGRRWPAHPALAESLAEALIAGGVSVRRADIAGVDAPLLDAAAKARTRSATGAAAVDMESHVASAFAARHGLIFAALRIVCDPAARSMPAVVANALRPDGEIDHLAIFADLVRKPTELTKLPRLAGEARASFRALSRCRDLLGIGRGLPNLVELLGDVA
jgi:adenosylhomocysteine nucleosidase